VQAFIEQHVGLFRDLFPGGELAGLQIGAQAGVVLGGLFIAVQIVAATAYARFTIGPEGVANQVEVLNVAGPRESQSPGITAEARQFLERILAS